MPNLAKLKAVLFEKNKTYEDCANELNISTTAFSNKMNGKSKFSVEEAQILSECLGLPVQDRVAIFLP